MIAIQSRRIIELMIAKIEENPDYCIEHTEIFDQMFQTLCQAISIDLSNYKNLSQDTSKFNYEVITPERKDT